MCRGGKDPVERRCSCDTSEARRLRRKKKAAHDRNQERAVQSSTLTTPNNDATGVWISSVESSMEQIAEERDKLISLKTQHDKLVKTPPNPTGVFTATINGERVTSRSRAELIALSEASQEKQVTVLGQHINSVVQQETGFTDSDIHDLYQDNKEKYVVELKSLNNKVIKAKISFLETLPSDLQTGSMSSAERLRFARERSEDNTAAEKAHQRMVEVEEESNVRIKQLQSYVKYGDEVIQKMAADNLQMTLKILSDMKPLGGEVHVDSESATVHLPALQAAAALYPADWVSASNDSANVMTVREAVDRGHYKARSGVEGKPELTIHSDTNPFHQVDGYRVAVHELAHRLEHVSDPFIFRMEEQFLTRRTTLPDGTREPLRKILDLNEPGGYTEDEVVYPDNFTHVYMGKKYEVKNREILSMGMESIFCGSHGGLIGLNDYKPDMEMKNFIVGMLGS